MCFFLPEVNQFLSLSIYIYIYMCITLHKYTYICPVWGRLPSRISPVTWKLRWRNLEIPLEQQQTTDRRQRQATGIRQQWQAIQIAIAVAIVTSSLANRHTHIQRLYIHIHNTCTSTYIHTYMYIHGVISYEFAVSHVWETYGLVARRALSKWFCLWLDESCYLIIRTLRIARHGFRATLHHVVRKGEGGTDWLGI